MIHFLNSLTTAQQIVAAAFGSIFIFCFSIYVADAIMILRRYIRMYNWKNYGDEFEDSL